MFPLGVRCNARMNTIQAERAAIALAAADALAARADEVRAMRAVAGFDAMVDSIVRAVDTRPGPDRFVPMERIAQLAERVAGAAGQSVNIELAVERVKIGGNGVLMADGLATLGLRVAFIGNIAAEQGGVHPVFRDFASRCSSVHPTSPPGATDAVEFSDGKVMLGKTAPLNRVTWASVSAAAGGDAAIAGLLDGASVLVPVSWTMLPHLNEIWRGLVRVGMAPASRERRPWVFIDLADPAKRSDDELRGAIDVLREMAAVSPLCLGLNLAESRRIARTIGAPERSDIRSAAETLRATLGFACVVVHRREGAAAAAEHDSAAFAGPFLRHPRMSTGAGDNFNAGFCLGWRLGLPIAQALAVGVGTSGLYVRRGEATRLEDLIPFLRALPEPEA